MSLRFGCLIAVAFAITACGSKIGDGNVNKRGGTAGVQATLTKAAVPSPTSMPAGSAAHTAGAAATVAAAPAAAAAVAAPLTSVDRTVDLVYFEADAGLADLFSASGTSELCWPAAMGYQLEYFRHHRAPVMSLVEAPAFPGASRADSDMRSYAESCNTSVTTGTTVPQGVGCLQQQFEDSGLTASLGVIGVDAVWGAAGDYPASVSSSVRAVTPDDVRAALRADAGVIMMIGYYTFNTSTSTWTRSHGHFLSITGFQEPTGNTTLTVNAVNPATNYASRVGQPHFDQLIMQQMTQTNLPAQVGYQLTGIAGASTETVLVESIVLIAAPTATDSTSAVSTTH